MNKRLLLITTVAILAILVASIGAYLLFVMIGPGVPICRGHTYVFVVFPLFRYEELNIPYIGLRKLGTNLIVMCPGSSRETVIGIDKKNMIHRVRCVNSTKLPSTADAYVLVGGPGLTCILLSYLSSRGLIEMNNETMQLLAACRVIAREFNINYSRYYSVVAEISREISVLSRENKVIAAICVAPTLLCIGGAVHGGEITMADVRPLVSFVRHECGATVLSTPIVVRGNIITVRGPEETALYRLTLMLAILCRSKVQKK